MFVLVVGGGKVGYYLDQGAASTAGHEVVLMEKDRARANQIADEIGSVVHRPRRLRGQVPRRGRREPGRHRRRGHRRRRGQPRRSARWPSTTSTCRGRSPASTTRRTRSCSSHLGVDELISPTRMILGSIEQDIPVHELLHLAALGERRARAHRGPPPGRLAGDRQGRARPRRCPEDCSLFAVIRDGVATPLRPETILAEGDKVIAIGKAACGPMLHDALIGDLEPTGIG